MVAPEHWVGGGRSGASLCACGPILQASIFIDNHKLRPGPFGPVFSSSFSERLTRPIKTRPQSARLVVCVFWQVGCLVGWLVGWLAGWLVGLLVCW